MKAYEEMRGEYPSIPGKEMKEFHALHLGLLDIPTEHRTAKQILHFCHQRLWPDQAFCNDPEAGCLGHQWDDEQARRVRLDNGADDFATLRDLVQNAKVQYSAYHTLAQGYLLDCGDHSVYRVQGLCKDLQEHCTLEDDDVTTQAWVKRLFSRSALIYGEADLTKPVISFKSPKRTERYRLEDTDSDEEESATPFWTGSDFPALPILRKTDRLLDGLSASYIACTKHWKTRPKVISPPPWKASRS